MKLALVISSLTGGGAERVMATLANAWVQQGFQVSLITIAGTDSDAYSLDPAVVRIGLGLNMESRHGFAALRNNQRRVSALRKIFCSRRPDVVLSFITSNNVLSVLAARPLRIPVIVSERVTLREHRLSVTWRMLRRYAYRRAAAAVVQTSDAALWFREHAPGVPVHVISNPLQLKADDTPDSVAQAVLDACRGCEILLAVGRLSVQKGYDLLLPAFAVATAKHSQWRLVVAGEGPERARIQAQITALGLSERVVLAGFTRTSQTLMRRASAYVLSSRYEGFPNALLEAMGYGLPCVSFDCPTGPEELIRTESEGLLVPPGDITALATALDRLMSDTLLRKKLGRTARDSVARFSLDRVLEQWNEVFGVVMRR